MTKMGIYVNVYFIDKAACTGCAACYAVCPESCIEMKADEEGFLYPEVNEEVCHNQTTDTSRNSCSIHPELWRQYYIQA